jgi:hypothetical protein
MKKVFLAIITVFLVGLLASCEMSGNSIDLSQDLEEFSESMLSMMADNLQGILRDPSLNSDTADEKNETDGERDETQSTDDESETDGEKDETQSTDEKSDDDETIDGIIFSE